MTPRFGEVGATAFKERVLSTSGGPLRAGGVSVLQVNLGYRCNLSCKHCHVSGGPTRTESMDATTAGNVLRVMINNPIDTLDLTGGAPELNPHFRELVAGARRAGRTVIVRTNLSVFFEPGLEDTPGFFHDYGVEVVASLSYYLEDGVDRVRGSGTFAKCITALQQLNGLGYGKDNPDLRLNLVYNPAGPFLAPAQAELEETYRSELNARFGITFSTLFTFTNMPVGRFRDYLVRPGGFDHDLGKLSCDFNQLLGLTVIPCCSRTIESFDFEALSRRDIAVDNHCYGCTAGQGSS